MKISFKLLFATCTIILAAACGNADYKKTASGITYKIFRKGTDKKVLPGEFLKVHYKASINDSLLYTTYDRVPAFGRYDTSAKNVHDFIDFLNEMNVGDSAVFIRSVDTMVARGFMMHNDVFKQGSTIEGSVTILETYPDEATMMAAQEKESNLELNRELAALEQYLEKEKMTGFTKVGKGVFVKVEQQGTGPQVTPGSKVTVNYTGQLKNGKKFDSNQDPAFNHVQPFEFVVGNGSVIKGWDEGLVQFKEGGKGRIVVPSMLGYGSQANGDVMPAFSDLIFDVEVLKVQPGVAPPAPQPPAQ